MARPIRPRSSSERSGSRPGAGPAFLLAEHRQRTLRPIARELGRHGRVQVATSTDDAAMALEERWTGVILGGEGRIDSLELLRFARRVRNDAPVALLTSGYHPSLGALCHRLEARVMIAPVDEQAVRRFAARAIAERASLDRGIAEVVAVLALERGLTAREADVLRLAAEGSRRTALSRALAIGENTVKGHVRGLLRKLGVSRMEAAGLVVLERLVRRGEPPLARRRGPSDDGDSGPGPSVKEKLR